MLLRFIDDTAYNSGHGLDNVNQTHLVQQGKKKVWKGNLTWFEKEYPASVEEEEDGETELDRVSDSLAKVF